MRRWGSVSVLCVSAALLVIVWRLLPASSPPIYDGLCLADPYRLLGSSPAPVAASQSYPAGNSFPASEVVTTETPPQAQVLITNGTFISQSPFKVNVAPIPPPAVRPKNGTFVGNVYAVSATTASGTELAPRQPVTILLRATASAGPARTVERLDGTSWTPLQTFSAGCGDSFETVSTKLGDFAVVAATGSTTPQSRTGSAPIGLIIGLILVVLIATVLGLLRINRMRDR